MQGRVVLGRYEVVQLLGHGSMGQAWLARDRVLARPAVVKVMNAAATDRPGLRDLFRREMQLMAAFRHPHAVEFYDADPERPCLVMEFVPGITLDRVLDHRRRLAPDDVGTMLLPLCQALQAAHTAGIVHRDLKPGNVMVAGVGRPADGVKVMDLGLAALATRPHIPLEQLRGAGTHYVAGTPAYVCPEQLRGDQADHRGDIYSLGVMLFELLTGRLPFDEADTQDLLRAHVSRPPPTFREAGMDLLPPAVERVVRQCLEKYPNERPQSAYEVASRFQAAVGRDPTLDRRGFEPVKTVAPVEPPVARRNDSDAITDRLEAYMPEPIAAVKLRGFVEDMGGTVVASEPGLIRVRLDPPKRKSSLFKWLSAPAANGPAPIAPIALDLHLARKGSGGRLEVTAVFRAVSGPLPNDPNWHRRCHDVLTRLRSHLMA
jgi:serine/threonine protein kinase